MIDVNLNSTDLRLVRPGETVPARALSSSSAEGKPALGATANDTDVTARFSAAVARSSQVQIANPVSQVEQAKEAQEAKKEKLNSAVTQLNDHVQNVQRDLHFEVDNELGQTIVKVVDQKTQKVIRQMPDELALKLAEKLQQDEPLTLFNIKV